MFQKKGICPAIRNSNLHLLLGGKCITSSGKMGLWMNVTLKLFWLFQMISDGWFEMIFDFCWIWMNFSPGLHHSVCFFDLMMFSNGWHWRTRCDLKKSPPNIVAFHGISWRHLTLEMTPKGLSPKADFFQQNRKKKSTFWAAQIRKKIRSTPSTQIQLWNLKKTTKEKSLKQNRLFTWIFLWILVDGR